MYPFSQAISPAAKNHVEAQLSFFNDLSKSMFRSVQQYSDLNIQLAQTMLEESTTTGQQILTSHRPTEIVAVAASHAQPAAEKLRAYQQHMSRIAADSQVDLSKVAEQHVVETARTAQALADEVARITTEETEKTMRKQEEAVRNFTDPFERYADGSMRHARGNEMRSSSTLQSANQHSEPQGSMQGGTQSSSAAQAQGASQGGKQPARKET